MPRDLRERRLYLINASFIVLIHFAYNFVLTAIPQSIYRKKEIILVSDRVPEVMNMPRANFQTTAILGLSDGDVLKQYTAIYGELALASENPEVNMNGSDKIPL